MRKIGLYLLFFGLSVEIVAQTIPKLDDPTVCRGIDAEIALPTLIAGIESERIVSVNKGGTNQASGVLANIVGRKIVMETENLEVGSTYDIIYEIDNSINSQISDTATVTIQDVPSGGTLVPNVSAICRSDDPALVTFSLTGVANNPTTYTWLIGTASATTGGTPTSTNVTVNLTGFYVPRYQISVNPVNSCGVGSPIEASVVMIVPQVLMVNLSASPFCEDVEGLTVTAAPIDPTLVGEQYRFTVGSTVVGYQTSNATNFAQGLVKDGDVVKVEVDLTNAAGCYVKVPTSTATLAVEGYKIPAVTTVSDLSEICENGTPNKIVVTATVSEATKKGVNEMAIYHDGKISDIKTGTLSQPFFSTYNYEVSRPSQSGMYTATAHNDFCPKGVSIEIPVNVISSDECLLGLESDVEDLKKLIYPNPASHQSEVYINGNGERSHIKIINSKGQVVLEQNVENFFSVEQLQAGIYHVFIQQKDKQMVTKLLIE